MAEYVYVVVVQVGDSPPYHTFLIFGRKVSPPLAFRELQHIRTFILRVKIVWSTSAVSAKIECSKVPAK